MQNEGFVYTAQKTSEFLSYYALPYINNPQTHPSYMKLFSPEWSNELKDKIRQSVKTYLPSIKYPVIYDLVTNDAGVIVVQVAVIVSSKLI